MYTIRPATAADLPFMLDMLYEAAIVPYVLHEMSPPPKAEVLGHASNARYLDGWGRAGDACVIAEDPDGGKLGAAWYRIFSAGERGDGIIAERDTPELSIGVAAEARGRGIGGALIEALLRRARDAGYGRVVLSVDPANAAQRLYRRCGFRDLAPGNPHAGTSILMEAML